MRKNSIIFDFLVGSPDPPLARADSLPAPPLPGRLRPGAGVQRAGEQWTQRQADQPVQVSTV